MPAPDLLKRDFTATGINQKGWHTSIGNIAPVAYENLAATAVLAA